MFWVKQKAVLIHWYIALSAMIGLFYHLLNCILTYNSIETYLPLQFWSNQSYGYGVSSFNIILLVLYTEPIHRPWPGENILVELDMILVICVSMNY